MDNIIQLSILGAAQNSSDNSQNKTMRPTNQSKYKKPKSSTIDYSQLNKAQLQAVQTIDGPLLIIAGPGTGKTTLLSYRIANILQKTDVPADAILALTFTESGVVAMKNKLAKLIGPEAYKVNIFTFHGFCNYIINEYPAYFDKLADYSVLSDLERIMLFDEILKDLNLKTLKGKFNNSYFLKNISSFISDLKREGIDLNLFGKILEIEKDMLNYVPKESKRKNSKDGLTIKYRKHQEYVRKMEDIFKIYTEYQARLEKLQKYDYEDMIDYVVRALETNPELLSTLQERFEYILLDEYQDTNTAQNRVVFKLAEYWGDKANVFAVGDDDQSIYRFQGASVSNILDFMNTFSSNLKIITLRENYRSTQNILDAAYELIKHSSTNLLAHLDNLDKHLNSNVGYPNQKIAFGQFSSNIAEALFIVDKIKELEKQNVPLEEIAILVRNHWQMDDIIDLLQRNNIPYVRVGGDNALENPYVEQFISLLRVVSQVANKPSDDSELFKVMHYKFLGLPYVDIIKFARFVSLKARETSADKQPLNSIDYVMADNWEKVAVDKVGISQDAAKQIREFYEKLVKWYSDSYNNSLAKYIEIILNESGLLDYILTLPSKFEDLNAINSFFLEVKALTASKPFMPIEEFLEAIDLITKYNIKIKIRDLVKPKGGVQVLTAHASKGLEFDYVFIAKFIDKSWGDSKGDKTFLRLPYYVLEREIKPGNTLIENRLAEINNWYKSGKDTHKKQLIEEDARRLFYVALTRARKKVFITMPQVIIAQNGKDSEQVPSRFIAELPEELIEPIDTSPYNKLENQEALVSLLRKTPYANVYINTVKQEEYLKQIVANFKLSPSALIAFLKDPEQFYLQYLLKVPSVPNMYAVYGTAFHRALQHIFTFLRNNKKYPDIESTHAAFKRVVDNSLLLQEQKQKILENGKKDLELYLNNLQKQVRKPMYMEKRAILSFAGVPLTGVLDMIEYIDKDKGIVRIVDFKTGQKFSKNQILGITSAKDTHYLDIPEFKHKFKLQLYFYKLLFDLHPELNKGKLTAKYGRIEFVEPNKGTTYLPAPVDIEYEPTHEEVLKQLIIDSWQKIAKLEFGGATVV